MIAYVDSSVILRLVLHQEGRLAEWRRIETAVTSALTTVECHRTLQRRHHRELLSSADLVTRREIASQLIERMERTQITPNILRRAAEPFPLPLGSLDAIHLASALAWEAANGTMDRIAFATHDVELGRAANACGLTVLGV